MNPNPVSMAAYGATAPSSANSEIPKDPFSTETKLSWSEFRQKLTQYYGASTTVADAFPSWKENDTVAQATRAHQQTGDHQAFFRFSSEELNSLAVTIHKNVLEKHGLVRSDAPDAMQEAKKGAQDASKPRKPDFRDERREAKAKAAQILAEYSSVADAASSTANSNNDVEVRGRAPAASPEPLSVASAPASTSANAPAREPSRAATQADAQAATRPPAAGARGDLLRRKVLPTRTQNHGSAPAVVSMGSAPQKPQQEESRACSCNWLANYFRFLKV